MKQGQTRNREFEEHLLNVPAVLTTQGEAFEAIRRDFGGIAEGCPLGLIEVGDEAGLRAVLELANQFNVRLTLRCGGNSQSGQSLANRSYCLGLSALAKFVEIDVESGVATCSTSCSWRDVVEACAPHRLLPKVVPLNLDLSVGGTLSAGGIGAASHRYGSAASNVLALAVITGAGEKLACSRAARGEVLDVVLGGLGMSAIITSASIALRRFKPVVRTVFALYASLEQCLKDIEFLSTQPDCAYIEGSCSPCFQGLRLGPRGREPLFRWFYGIQFSVEHDADDAPDFESLLGQLRCLEIVHQETDDHMQFIDRYQARFEAMRRTGAWNQAHPWFECMVPPDRAPAFIRKLLSLLPPFFGDGHRLFAVSGESNPRYLQLPVNSLNRSLAVAILPAGIPESSLPSALDFVQFATELVHRYGGKRYLSGWLGTTDEAFWRRHHGSVYEQWEASKRELDPNRILANSLLSQGRKTA